jgi:hypothetical protein
MKVEVQRSEIELDHDHSALFIQHLPRNLHIVLVASPSGTVYRDICVYFPAIRPDCVIDWCMLRSVRALESVALENLSSAGARHALPVFLRLCVAMHRSVEDRATKILAETKRFGELLPPDTSSLCPSYKLRSSNVARRTLCRSRAPRPASK